VIADIFKTCPDKLTDFFF